MPKRTRDYRESLLESLKDPKEAIAYLNAHLEESDKDAEELFLMALRDVATAFGVGEIAKEAKPGRESLYKALSKTGNPKLSTLVSLLDAVGLRLSVDVKQTKKASGF